MLAKIVFFRGKKIRKIDYQDLILFVGFECCDSNFGV